MTTDTTADAAGNSGGRAGRRTTPSQRTGKPRAANKGVTVKTRPDAIADRDKRKQAVDLRRAGMTFDQIATQVGYADRASAYNAVTRYLREYPREDVEDLREITHQRYEQIIRSLYTRVLSGDTWAIDRVLRALDQQAKLHGLNRPEKVEVTGASDLDVAMRELLAEMTAKANGAPVPQE